jgi:hypothetical protein
MTDGYNRSACLSNGDWFVYRALTRHDRAALESEFRNLPALIAEKWERQIVERQIVVSHWDCAVADFEDDLYRELATLVLGYDTDEQEIADETNLANGVYLRTRWPWLFNTPCSACRKWLYDPVAGKLFQNNVDGEMQPLPRPDGYPLLCEGGTCPKGHWSNPVELSEKNKLALQYCETFAASSDDAVASRNRRVIQNAVDRAREDVEVDGRAEGGGHASDQSRRHGRGRRRGGATATAGA